MNADATPVGATPAREAPGDPARRPNIVLINCDDLGYGDLGCYGSDLQRHPGDLDRMAAEGVRFTDFYMASPVCSPSRAAMLTGCYPLRIGFGGLRPRLRRRALPGQGVGLHPDEITIARLLSTRATPPHAVGKWHCGDQPEFLPTRHGFDEYYGMPYSNDMGRQAIAADGQTDRRSATCWPSRGSTGPGCAPRCRCWTATR